MLTSSDAHPFRGSTARMRASLRRMRGRALDVEEPGPVTQQHQPPRRRRKLSAALALAAGGTAVGLLALFRCRKSLATTLCSLAGRWH